jgi:uncharacterized protein
MLRALLKPNIIINSFDDLKLNVLSEKIDLILVDCDNTLINKATHEFNQCGIDWIKAWLAKNKKAVLISNNKHPLFDTLASELKIPLYQMAMKPLSPYYSSLVKTYKVHPSQVMVIGDQLITDILGGKLNRFKCVYHKPLSSKDVLYNNIIRKIEKKWIQYYESNM